VFDQQSDQNVTIDYALKDFDDIVTGELNWGTFDNGFFQGLPQNLSTGLTIAASVLGNGSDFDGDGDVDMSDFGVIQACIGSSDPSCQRADLNRDGIINSIDVANWRGCSSGANIPASASCLGKGQLGVEIIDVNGFRASYLLNVTSALQNYVINLTDSAPTSFDTTRVAQIKFISDRAHMGAKGLISIETAHLQYHPFIPPATDLTAADITLLRPTINTTTSSGAHVTMTRTEDGMTVDYQTAARGWADAGINYSNPDLNITNMPKLVVGINQIAGNLDQIKLEFLDANLQRASVYLTGLAVGEQQIYEIDTSLITSIDKSKIRGVIWVMEGFGKTGQIDFDFVETASPYIPPSPNLNTTDIINLPVTGAGLFTVTSSGATANVVSTSRGQLLNFNTGNGSFAGWGTKTVPVGMDISHISKFVVGIRLQEGDIDKVKFELKDAQGRTASVYLRDLVLGQDLIYEVDLSYFADKIDLQHVLAQTYLVEGKTKIGKLEFITYPVTPTIVIAPSENLSSHDLTQLPPHNMTTVNYSGGNTVTFSRVTSRGVELGYAIPSEISYAGIGYRFDVDEPADLSSTPNLILGIQNSSDIDKVQVQVQYMDPNTGIETSRKISLSGLADDEQVYSISTAMLESIKVNIHAITGIIFLLQGPGAGVLEISDVPTQAMDILPSSGLTAADVTVIPDHPRLQQIGDNSSVYVNAGGMKMVYNTGTTGWAASSLNFDDYGVPGVQTGDLSGITDFIFGVKGDADQLKVEFHDRDGNRKFIYLHSIRSGETRYYSIPASVIREAMDGSGQVDLSRITEIVFVVEGTNQQGNIEIATKGFSLQGALLAPDPVLQASTLLPLRLDGSKVEATGFASADNPVTPGDDGAMVSVDHFSDTFLRVNYSGNGDSSFGGIFMNYDDYSTPMVEAVDLEALYPNGITLRLDNPDYQISSVDVEVTDIDGKQGKLTLSGLQGYGQSWTIDPHWFDEVNINGVKTISLVLKGRMTNAVLNVDWGVFRFTPILLPDPILQPADITPIVSTPLPALNVFSSTSEPNGVAQVVMQTPSRSMIDLKYEGEGPASFGGTAILFDNQQTPSEKETADLHALFPDGKFVLQASSPDNSLTSLKLEVKDATGKSDYVMLSGIQTTDQRWQIALSAFDEVDLTHVTEIVFVIEGMGSRRILIDWGKFDVVPQIGSSAALTPEDIIPLPDNPQITGLGGTPETLILTPTERGVRMNYDVRNDFAGVGFTFDNFATPEIETQDLTGFNALTFGVQNVLANEPLRYLKFEVVDDQGQKSTVQLLDLGTGEEHVYSIALSLLEGVDLTKVRFLYFVVEGYRQSGTIEINRLPTIPVNIAPSPDLTPRDIVSIPENPYPQIAVAAPEETYAAVSAWFRGGVLLEYDTRDAGWAAGGYTYDDFGTPAYETADLSAFSELTFGLKGDPSQVKFELVDDHGRKASVHLTDISSTEEHVYSIHTSLLDSIDLSKVRLIYFVVEGMNQAGQLEMYRKPLVLPTVVPPSTEYTIDDVNIKNSDWLIFDSQPNSGGSVTKTADGIYIDYSGGKFTYSGMGGWRYDDSATVGVTETKDLSGLENLIFGLKGTLTGDLTPKLTLRDVNGNSASVDLTGISRDNIQVWAVSALYFPDIDLSKVVEVRFSLGYAYNIIASNLYVYTNQLPDVPEGWTRAESNMNFAFYKEYFRAGAYPTWTLKLLNLMTGEKQDLISLNFSQGSIWDVYDVSPDGTNVIYATHVPQSCYSPTSEACDQIYVQDIENSAQKLTLGGHLEHISFPEEDSLRMIASVDFRSGAALEYDYVVTLGLQPVVLKTAKFTQLSDAFYNDQDAKIMVLVEPDSYYYRLFLYDAMAGEDQLVVLTEKAVNTYPFGSSAEKFLDVYRISEDRAIVAVGIQPSDYTTSILFDAYSGQSLYIPQKMITQATYQDSIGIYKTVDQAGTESVLVVDLETLTIIETTMLDPQTVVVPSALGRPVMYYMTDKNLLVYQTVINYNSLLAIKDLATGAIHYQSIPNFGWSGIKAISPDRNYVVAASNVNTIYAIPILDTVQSTRTVNVPVPTGGKPTDYMLTSVTFTSATAATCILANGVQIGLYLDSTKFSLTGQMVKIIEFANKLAAGVYDFSGDGVINTIDMTVVRGLYGKAIELAKTNALPADVLNLLDLANPKGVLDNADMQMVYDQIRNAMTAVAKAKDLAEHIKTGNYDLTHDGKVNTLDLLWARGAFPMIIEYSANFSSDVFTTLDLNRDGVLNNADYTLLLLKIRGAMK